MPYSSQVKFEIPSECECLPSMSLIILDFFAIFPYTVFQNRVPFDENNLYGLLVPLYKLSQETQSVTDSIATQS